MRGPRNSQTQPNAAFLRTVAIFSEVDTSALELIAPLFTVHRLATDAALFYQGDTGDSLYIVHQGRIAVTVHTDTNDDITVATLEAGDFLGEMSIFEDELRSATCHAVEPTEVYRLDKEEFNRLIDAQPVEAIKIMRAMLEVVSARLEDRNALLADMVQWGEEARRRAFTDELTGLYNRRFLDESLPEHIATAATQNAPLTLVMMDLDHFTSINNEYGHEIGDKLIAAIAPAIKTTFRDTDILVRYGGDEFTFVLPHTPAPEAVRFCEALGVAIAQCDFLAHQGGSITTVTTSQGIAVYPDHGRTVDELRERADRALYAAKERGRNRYHLFDEN